MSRLKLQHYWIIKDPDRERIIFLPEKPFEEIKYKDENRVIKLKYVKKNSFSLPVKTFKRFFNTVPKKDECIHIVIDPKIISYYEVEK